MSSRGKFIVFQGLDRSGKTTASKHLASLLTLSSPCFLTSFPNRTSPIGKLINDYLSKGISLSPQLLHLLFSANRWQYSTQLQILLEQGTTVICDRYYFSGIAYSYANGVDLEWARHPDQGLREPDLVIYLKSDPEVLAKRQGYGEEAFEKVEFQLRVKEGYEKLFEGNGLVEVLEVGEMGVEEVKERVERIVKQKFGL